MTFHDPCYLARYNDTVAEPRAVLTRIGVKPVEMERSGKTGFCCGAGGGRVFLEERIGKRVNVERTEQALATGASTVAVGCPFCMTMMTDGTKAKGVDEQVKVKDLAELVAERLKAQDLTPQVRLSTPQEGSRRGGTARLAASFASWGDSIPPDPPGLHELLVPHCSPSPMAQVVPRIRCCAPGALRSVPR